MLRQILPAAFLASMLAAAAGSPATAQSSATSIISVATTSSHNPQLRFTVASERNVREYRVMAGANTDAMQEVARVKPSGFSAGPRTYKVPLANTSFRYFRVCAVAMDGALCWGESKGTDLHAAPPDNVTAVATVR